MTQPSDSITRKLLTAIWVIGAIAAVVAFGQLFRTYTFYFTVAWLLCPAIAWIVKQPTGTSRRRRAAMMITAVALSFVHFAHYDWLRDKLGQAYIPGYQVEYYEDVDDNGRPTRRADVSIPNERDRHVVTVAELAFAVLLVGIPVMTWRVFAEPSQGAE